MKIKKSAELFGALTALLLAMILFKLSKVSTGMNISGFVLGGILIFGIALCCLVLTWLFKLILETLTFWTLYLMLTTVALMLFLINLYL